MRDKFAITFFLLLLIAGLSLAEECKSGLAPVASFVHPDARGKLPIIGTVAVVLSGSDRPMVRMLEDALALGVLSESIRVVYPGEKEMGKNRQTPAEPLEFARKLGVNSLITGNVLGCCGGCLRGGGDRHSPEIRAVSLSLVDVPQDKVLVWAFYEPEKGARLAEISRAFIGFLIESLNNPKPEEEKR